jgi:hypothetical protein
MMDYENSKYYKKFNDTSIDLIKLSLKQKDFEQLETKIFPHYMTVLFNPLDEAEEKSDIDINDLVLSQIAND